MAQKVTSTDIKLALKEFHNGKPSYFITECKTCSTYFPDPQGLLKFDGLAITKSYGGCHKYSYDITLSTPYGGTHGSLLEKDLCKEDTRVYRAGIAIL